MPTGIKVLQVDVVTGLMACIGSFPSLRLASSVVYERHLVPESSYFAIINKNIIILRVYLPYRCYGQKSLPNK